MSKRLIKKVIKKGGTKNVKTEKEQEVIPVPKKKKSFIPPPKSKED